MNVATSATVGGITTDCTYDGSGSRVSATTSWTTTNDFWADTRGLSPLVDDGTIACVSPDGLQAAIDGSGTTSSIR